MQSMASGISTKPARNLIAAVVILCLLVATGWMVLHGASKAHAASTVTVNGATTFQTIDGFGFSEAFGRAASMNSAPASAQKQMLDYLFSPTSGAGFTILRNIINTDSSGIEPNSPGSPSSPPTYVWDGSDSSQVWLSKQAQSYGVNQIYADAWSAPAFMKTNNSNINGGTLCGVPGATCSSGDWRQAYANFLVQYARDYNSAGIPLTAVDFTNEPEIATSYASMQLNATQMADFIKVLGPALTQSGLPTRLACCDFEGWGTATSSINTIMSDPTAASNVGLFTSHGYTAPPNSTITSIGSRHIWESEWTPSQNENSWDPAWDDGTDASGFTWANRIYTGLTSANLSAFNYWWGANTSNSNSGVVELSGSTVTPAARLWAFANYSRFIRPGAVRVSGTSTDSNLDVTAAKNTDGTYAIVVLNTSSSDIPASFALQNVGSAFAATPYLTNGSNSLAQQPTISFNGGAFSATIPARSQVTYKISVETPITPTPTRTGTTPTPTATPTMGATSTPTPPPTATTVPPTSTPTSGGNGVTATGTVASNSPYFGEEDIKFSNTSSVTALTATITVQKTTGVSYSSAYTTFGGVTMTHADNGSTITYTFTLNSGQTITPSSNLITAAQFGGTGTAHSTTGDLWSITTTSGGKTNTLSGHF